MHRRRAARNPSAQTPQKGADGRAVEGLLVGEGEKLKFQRRVLTIASLALISGCAGIGGQGITPAPSSSSASTAHGSSGYSTNKHHKGFAGGGGGLPNTQSFAHPGDTLTDLYTSPACSGNPIQWSVAPGSNPFPSDWSVTVNPTSAPCDGNQHTITVTIVTAKDSQPGTYDDQIICSHNGNQESGTLEVVMSDLELIDMDSGADLTKTTTLTSPETKIVGQPVHYQLASSTGRTITNVQWTMPTIPEPLKSYVLTPGVVNHISTTVSAIATALSSADLTQVTLPQFYWISPRPSGGGQLSATAMVNGVQDQAVAYIQGLAPSPSIPTPTLGTVALDQNYGYGVLNPLDEVLHNGNWIKGATHGISWQYSVSGVPQGDNGGRIAMVQLINSSQLTVNDGTNTRNFRDSGLDNVFPYAPEVSVSASYRTDDSPGTEFTSISASGSEQQSFTDYFLYEPNISGSIWVPLASMTWTWSGSFTHSGIGWVPNIPSGDPSMTPVQYSLTPNEPTWTGVDINNAPTPC